MYGAFCFVLVSERVSFCFDTNLLRYGWLSHKVCALFMFLWTKTMSKQLMTVLKNIGNSEQFFDEQTEYPPSEIKRIFRSHGPLRSRALFLIDSLSDRG